MMIFRKTVSPGPIAEIIAEKIAARLETGQKIFWLVTGGSAIKLEAKAAQLLKNHDLTNLSVSLTDERFGPVGHEDSNWQQLKKAGFELPGAKLLPILNGSDRAAATAIYGDNLQRELTESDYSIGVFGIGPDGHVAGILPGSPNINTQQMAVGYSDSEISIASPEGVKRGLDRITMSAKAIARLDEAIVSAFGETKWPWLGKLEASVSIEQNPLQALKRAKNLIIYNDYKGQPL